MVEVFLARLLLQELPLKSVHLGFHLRDRCAGRSPRNHVQPKPIWAAPRTIAADRLLEWNPDVGGPIDIDASKTLARNADDRKKDISRFHALADYIARSVMRAPEGIADDGKRLLRVVKDAALRCLDT